MITIKNRYFPFATILVLPVNTLVDFNFSGEQLINADLSNLNMTGANFFGANLTGADLTNSILVGANFQQATLTNATLYGQNLNLYGCNFYLTIFGP